MFVASYYKDFFTIFTPIPPAVSAILQDPPTVNFFAKTELELSAAPLSQMLETEETNPSMALQRTHSSTSEDSTFSITPNSSMDSQQMRRVFDRKTASIDSSDADPSLQRLGSHSSISSDGSIIFSPPPRMDHSSSTSLSAVPEYAPPGEFMGYP